MKKNAVTLVMLLVAVSCNQRDLTSEFFSGPSDDAKCFDWAILVPDADQVGVIQSLTYAKGLCYNNSPALDATRSFTTPAVIVNRAGYMFASFVRRKDKNFFISDEQGQYSKIGELDTSFGQAAIRLAPSFKVQIARELDHNGQYAPVMILEQQRIQ